MQLLLYTRVFSYGKAVYAPDGHWPDVYAKVFEIIRSFAQHGVTEFISGGALGFDQVAARAVIGVEEIGHPVKLTMALPFPGFESKWIPKSKREFAELELRANKTLYVCDAGYAPWKMQRRNEWMVNESTIVIALYGPDKTGGTLNCIHYAMTLFRPIVKIHPITQVTTSMVWETISKEWKEVLFKL